MLIADAVYTAWVDAGKPILLDIAREDSPEQRGHGAECNKPIVPNKNKKEKGKSDNKNHKKKRVDKDNAMWNVVIGNKKKTMDRVFGGVAAFFVAFIAAYLFNNRRKKKKGKG